MRGYSQPRVIVRGGILADMIARRGYTVKTLSACLPITAGHLSRIKNGTPTAPPTAKVISKRLGCRMEDLFEVVGGGSDVASV